MILIVSFVFEFIRRACDLYTKSCSKFFVVRIVCVFLYMESKSLSIQLQSVKKRRFTKSLCNKVFAILDHLFKIVFKCVLNIKTFPLQKREKNMCAKKN